jgi:hypothetical protein
MGFARLVIAWALSMAIYAAIIAGWSAAKGEATGGLGKGVVEGFLGLGILLAIPTFLFAVVIAWPTMSWLASLRPSWILPPAAAAAFALLMWLLASLMLPDGWRGAGHALVGYAAVLGLVWGCLNLAAAPAS